MNNILNITHSFALELGGFGILDGVSSIDDFIKNARRVGKEQNEQLTAIDKEDPLSERNRIVGDAFEVFGEFLLKYKGNDDRFLISKYGRSENDNGIDGIGIHSGPKSDPKNGVQVFIQFKCYQEFDGAKTVRLMAEAYEELSIAECM